MDINQLLKKLKEIDVEDLQNINYKALLKKLLKRRDLLIDTIAVVLTFIFIVFFLSTNGAKMKEIKMDLKTLKSKDGLITKYNKTKDELETFIKNSPKNITSENFITLLNDFAQESRVEIQTVTPKESASLPNYNKYTLSLTVTTQEYTNMWEFLHLLESSPYAIRVENWRASTVASARGGNRAKKLSDIRSNLDVTLINLKNL